MPIKQIMIKATSEGIYKKPHDERTKKPGFFFRQLQSVIEFGNSEYCLNRQQAY